MPGTYFHTVLADANVLYSRTLRDWPALIYLDADDELFRVCYSTDILAEVARHLRKAHPDWDGNKIDRARRHSEDTFGEENRVTDFAIDPNSSSKDPGDGHVHSAAIACRADILLTCNVAHFTYGQTASDELPYEGPGAR